MRLANMVRVSFVLLRLKDVISVFLLFVTLFTISYCDHASQTPQTPAMFHKFLQPLG